MMFLLLNTMEPLRTRDFQRMCSVYVLWVYLSTLLLFTTGVRGYNGINCTGTSDAVQNFSCVNNNMKSLICNWTSADPTALYTHTYQHYDGLEPQQHNLSPDSTYLEWNSGKHMFMPLEEIYKVSIEVQRKLMKEVVNCSINSYEVLLPDVSKLKCISSSRELKLSWNIIGLSISPIMEYEIQCQNQFSEIIDTRLVTNESLTISGLQPFTEYRITQRSRSKNGIRWSKNANITCSTLEDVPEKPEINKNGFHVVTNQNTSDVAFYFKELLQTKWNSRNISYSIEVCPTESRNGTDCIAQDRKNGTIVFRNLLSHVNYSASLRAVNVAGKSEAAIIDIPASDSRLKNSCEIRCNFTGNCTVHWNRENNTTCTVFWCPVTSGKCSCDGQILWKEMKPGEDSLNVTENDLKHYIFGSGISQDSAVSGITWSKCIIQDKNEIYRPKTAVLCRKNGTCALYMEKSVIVLPLTLFWCFSDQQSGTCKDPVTLWNPPLFSTRITIPVPVNESHVFGATIQYKPYFSVWEWSKCVLSQNGGNQIFSIKNRGASSPLIIWPKTCSIAVKNILIQYTKVDDNNNTIDGPIEKSVQTEDGFYELRNLRPGEGYKIEITVNESMSNIYSFQLYVSPEKYGIGKGFLVLMGLVIACFLILAGFSCKQLISWKNKYQSLKDRLQIEVLPMYEEPYPPIHITEEDPRPDLQNLIVDDPTPSHSKDLTKKVPTANGNIVDPRTTLERPIVGNKSPDDVNYIGISEALNLTPASGAEGNDRSFCDNTQISVTTVVFERIPRALLPDPEIEANVPSDLKVDNGASSVSSPDGYLPIFEFEKCGTKPSRTRRTNRANEFITNNVDSKNSPIRNLHQKEKRSLLDHGENNSDAITKETFIKAFNSELTLNCSKSAGECVAPSAFELNSRVRFRNELTIHHSSLPSIPPAEVSREFVKTEHPKIPNVPTVRNDDDGWETIVPSNAREITSSQPSCSITHVGEEIITPSLQQEERLNSSLRITKKPKNNISSYIGFLEAFNMKPNSSKLTSPAIETELSVPEDHQATLSRALNETTNSTVITTNPEVESISNNTSNPLIALTNPAAEVNSQSGLGVDYGNKSVSISSPKNGYLHFTEFVKSRSGIPCQIPKSFEPDLDSKEKEKDSLRESPIDHYSRVGSNDNLEEAKEFYKKRIDGNFAIPSDSFLSEKYSLPYSKEFLFTDGSKNGSSRYSSLPSVSSKPAKDKILVAEEDFLATSDREKCVESRLSAERNEMMISSDNHVDKVRSEALAKLDSGPPNGSYSHVGYGNCSLTEPNDLFEKQSSKSLSRPTTENGTNEYMRFDWFQSYPAG